MAGDAVWIVSWITHMTFVNLRKTQFVIKLIKFKAVLEIDYTPNLHRSDVVMVDTHKWNQMDKLWLKLSFKLTNILLYNSLY